VSLKFLLDTNVVSEPLKPKPASSVLRRLRRHEGQVAIPSIVWHELRFGCARLAAGRRRRAIQRYLDEVVLLCFPILDYDQDAAAWHAQERARLEAAGDVPPFIDGQIASIAGVRGLTLVTGDRNHFKRFKGLRVVSWR
jgi:tRNA(fMet)-specific endonuclease VapC